MIMIRWFVLFSMLVVASGSSAFSQKVTANVKIIRDKLQGRNLDLFEGMEQKITSYVNNYDWSKTGDNTPMPVDIQIFLEKVSEVNELRRVHATMFFSNGKVMQSLDKECIFSIRKGAVFYHDENVIDPFLSIIDFYIYIMLGDEMDSLGKLLGTPFFQKARSLATQAKAFVPENVSGWDARLLKSDDFLDLRYQEYRIMKDHFYEAVSQLENEDAAGARQNATKALDILERIYTKNITSYHSERFIALNYLDFCKIFARSGEKKIYDRLIALDPKNKDTYLKYRNEQN